ncbi:MAG: alpha-ketoacid dehydrogenase subunit beta [Candidatus Rokubacteria bacterium]|nr:alpha-ketoacid dehydrogenase subunit beta [Candidatus Rokubacteria bacterium]
MRELKYWQAVNEALFEEMARDDRVCLAGEDVAEPGGPFGASRGLLDKFGPWRVKDTPISEAAIAGLAVGAALAGMRPVVEIMFLDFMCLAMDQVVNQAAKACYMSGGRLQLPITIRTLCGAGRNNGPQHSQSLEAWLCHVPGLKVVWPSTPADAKGLLKSAVRDENPVVVIDSLSLWTSKSPVPEGEFTIPIGKAEVKRPGSDATVVAVGSMVPRALAAAQRLAAEGIQVEVLDLRTLSPLDREAILASVAKTHRLVIAHDAVKPFGFGAEIAAMIAEEALEELDARVKRVAAPYAPVPFSPPLEGAYYPQASQIEAAVKMLLGA